MNRIVVNKYGVGDCASVQEAFDMALSVEGHVEIYIHNGIYNEKLRLERDDVTITGENAVNTVLTYKDHANMTLEDGSRMGTLRSASMIIRGENVVINNLTVENRAGNGVDAGQAIALSLYGDRICVKNCRLLGCQDTLFVGPGTECPQDKELEMAEIPEAPDARMYFEKCYIEGDVDFIFGGATAYFDNCEIFSRYNITEDDERCNGQVKGYVAAPCTWQKAKYGFVFDKCNFTGDCPDNTVYLGRPWRIFAKTVLLSCNVGRHIKTEGWHDWNKEAAHGRTFFAEYDCRYEAEVKRADWITTLNDNEAKAFTKENVLWEGFCEE